jgi:hypothetical protein
MGLSIQAGFAIKKISEYSEFKKYKTVMEYGCQTISTTTYPLLKEHIFPNLNINFKGEYAPAKELYNHLGLKYNSMDANGEYNSLIVDFNEDLQSKYQFTEKFDLCTNLGTSEHLIGQTTFFKNIHNTTKVNGIMLNVLPMEGYHGHCYFNYHPNFFYDLASSNKYEIKEFWYFSQRGSKLFKHYSGQNFIPLNFNNNLINDLENLAKKGIYRSSLIDNCSSICVIYKKTEDNEFKLPFQDDSMVLKSGEKNKIAGYAKHEIGNKFEDIDNSAQIRNIIGTHYWKVIISEIFNYTSFGKIILSKMIYKIFNIKTKYFTDVKIAFLTLKNAKNFIKDK